MICGTASGKVYIYDAHDGKRLQVLDPGATVEGGMAFSQGLVVVPSGDQVVPL